MCLVSHARATDHMCLWHAQMPSGKNTRRLKRPNPSKSLKVPFGFFCEALTPVSRFKQLPGRSWMEFSGSPQANTSRSRKAIAMLPRPQLRSQKWENMSQHQKLTNTKWMNHSHLKRSVIMLKLSNYRFTSM